MEKMKKFFKERKNGFLLLFFAAVIIYGFSGHSRDASSKEPQNLSGNGQAVAGEQVTQSDPITSPENDQEVSRNSSDLHEETTQKSEISEKKVDDKNMPDSEKSRCDDLRRLLKKYCGKNYDVKKCRDYLVETRDLSKEDGQCKSLYKKYHFVPNEEKKKDDNSSSTSTSSENSDIKGEATLSINYAGSKADDEYAIAIEPGMTVMDMMKKAKNNNSLSYDESTAWPGYIQGINNIREDISKNIFWMLYSNGKMASEGASTLKVNTGDKIEWRYMEVSLW